MKTIPPPCPEPESGQRYWRSLDQLADAPEFRQWLEREFPDGASEFGDGQSRRHFVKLMSASFLLGGLGVLGSGCRRPEEKILPFGKMPEGYVHGVPQFFATAMPTRGGAVPLLVKSHENRPTKIEGNPDHPDSNGATDTFAQASLLSLYDPDRAQRFTRNGNTISRESALDALGTLAKEFTANRGNRVAFLLEQSSSPSRLLLLYALQKKYPQAKWAVYEPVDLAPVRALTGSAPYYKLDQANVLVSLDCDFIGTEADTHRLIRGFARRRKTVKATDAMNRLYAVEGLMTLTGMSADHRLRVATGQVVAVAAQLAARLAPQNTSLSDLAKRLPLPAGVNPKWIEECAKDLEANRGASVVMAGHRQPAAVHLIANLLNTALGNNGKTVFFSEMPGAPTNTDLAGLARDLALDQIDTLVILGANPALTAPADLKWEEAQKKAKQVVRLSGQEDETLALSRQASLGLPAAHYLESWGDARTSDGTVVAIQPLIAPLFDGVTELEVLARLGGMDLTKPYDIVRDTFKGFAGKGPFEEAWKKFLHDGFVPGPAPRSGDAPIGGDIITREFASVAAAAPAKDSLEVVFHRDLKMDDGRWNNSGWLHEFPDPVTKITWDNVILISRKTAEELGVKNGDVVKLELGGRQLEGPAWIQPGQADYSLGLALGYGRKQGPAGGTGRIGHEVGYNAYGLRSALGAGYAVGAKLTKTGRTHKIAVTQEHGSMDGRPIIREANKDQYAKHPKFARNFDLDSPEESAHIARDLKTDRPKGIYEHPYDGFEQRGGQNGVKIKGLFHSDVHQWAMSIDLSSCVGCGACVLACQSENNIPIVGKDQVTRNREMHWLRIDRYFSGMAGKGDKALVDDPQAVVQPMLCQHCENAPCESVCPVNATVHDEEGINVMAYNRCVGTRYCSNNCPYKVRRFNFFDYNKRSLDQLKGPYYGSPLTTAKDGEWNLARWWRNPDLGTRPDDEWDLLKLVKNPDVSVRMRGVMEKCTFCVQRVEQAKIAQKVRAGASGDVQLKEKEGTVPKTACQQVCPAEAI
ncbi:MAG TPA: TAT-variant-translocated molybdopterin oxidoreductase, partial [Candidatus Saccharimonadales bacterium]|nr:TAT-variant-translocated molybdopterin oxidoreductase [Candidatus Saccharimonadales bacterium]